MSEWERCGNTPFWKQESSLEQYYVDPVDFVALYAFRKPGKDPFSLKDTKTTVWKFQIADVGYTPDQSIPTPFGDFMTPTFAKWMNTIIKETTVGASKDELLKRFRELPQSDQNTILQSIQATVMFRPQEFLVDERTFPWDVDRSDAVGSFGVHEC